MYHWEADQEDFLVVSGEALLIIEGEERPLRPGTSSTARRNEASIVGAGDEPSVVSLSARATARWTIRTGAVTPWTRRPAGTGQRRRGHDRPGRGLRAPQPPPSRPLSGRLAARLAPWSPRTRSTASRSSRASGPAEREQLARVAADISSRRASTRRTEGSERALFVLLEGRIEAGQAGRRDRARPRRASSGRDLRRGSDRPRDRVPGGFRAAAEAARVMRIEPKDYHAVAALEAGPREGDRPARGHRMGGLRGLQGLASEPPPPRAVVIGHRWDPACRELRRFLDRNQITFRWAPPDDAGCGGGVGWAASAKAIVRRSASSAARPSCAHSTAGSPSCSAWHRGGRRGVRHGDRRRRSCGSRRGRVRSFGRAADDRDRARGARRPGRARRRGSRTTSAFRPVCRATSSRAARCSRREGSAPRSSSPGRSSG